MTGILQGALQKKFHENISRLPANVVQLVADELHDNMAISLDIIAALRLLRLLRLLQFVQV